MRLLHVVPTYFPAVRYGGPIFAVHGLCRALAARGHDVSVFTTSVDGSEDSAVPHGIPVILDGVKIHYFASNFLRRLYWAPSLARAMRDEMRHVDIVHLHSVFLWPTWAAGRLAQKSCIPYVVSPRGMLVKKLIHARSGLIKTAWIRLLEKSNLEHASAVHVTSQVEATDLAEFAFRLRRVAVVPNGVEEIEVAPTKDPPDDLATLALAQPLVLFFGRLSWKKGLEHLLRAFARTSTGALAIVGTDDEKLAPSLALLARTLNIAERVHLIPRTVTGSEKEFVFSAAVAFVLASCSENFGNTVLEAMHRGLPVIVTSNVGAADIVQESGGGIVVDRGPKPLGDAIDTLLRNASLAKSIGEAGRRYICQDYNWMNVAARMEALYETLGS